MDAALDTVATALYVRTDDLLKNLSGMGAMAVGDRDIPADLHAELVTLAVMQALLGFISEARWLRYARGRLRHLFAYLPGQSGHQRAKWTKLTRPSSKPAVEP